MALLEWIRPDPKCRHDRTRGFCSKCDGNTSDQRIPTGEFRVGRDGQLIPKKKR